ncbi:hypothetical protein ACFLQL_00330 [Verrucomicrobiota bacterium]
MNDYDNRVILTLLKQGQRKVSIKKKNTRPTLSMYPDYGKSIVTRLRRDPVTSGLLRGSSIGAVTAVLTALATRLALGNNASAGKVLAGAGVGGLAGFVPGYVSGSEEAKSDYTKLLFLRRLGIRSLGELGSSQDMPEAARISLQTERMI